MGAWGSGAFEDDDAVDWLLALMDKGDSTTVGTTLSDVATQAADVVVDVTEAAQARAAAEVIAAALDQPAKVLPEGLPEWARRHAGSLAGHRELALTAVRRVRESSELAELWEESDSRAEWLTEMTDLERRLTRSGLRASQE